MKKSNYTFVILCFVLVLVSCKGSSDDGQPVPPPPPDDDETEVVPDVYLMLFNASQEAGNLDIIMNAETIHSDLRSTKNTAYHHFEDGNILLVVREANNGATLLTKELTLEGGHLYSSYFYLDKEGNYDLILSKDFDDPQRSAPLGANVVSFTAIHLSKNIPFEGIDVYNVAANRSTPNGDLGITNRIWTDDLTYGMLQKNESSAFGNVANGLIFASDNSQPANVPDNQRIEIPGVTAQSIVTNEGSNGFGPFVTVFNTRPFESNVSYVFIAYEHSTNDGEPDGKIIVLNFIPIVN